MTINIYTDDNGNIKVTKERGFVVDEYNIYYNKISEREEVLNKLIHGILFNPDGE